MRAQLFFYAVYVPNLHSILSARGCWRCCCQYMITDRSGAVLQPDRHCAGQLRHWYADWGPARGRCPGPDRQPTFDDHRHLRDGALGMLALSLSMRFITLVACGISIGAGAALWNVSRHAYLANNTLNTSRGRAISIFAASTASAVRRPDYGRISQRSGGYAYRLCLLRLCRPAGVDFSAPICSQQLGRSCSPDNRRRWPVPTSGCSSICAAMGGY